jgi:hypothetical protein
MRSPAVPPDHEALRTAVRLDYMIGQITPSEFHWQDANYDRNSALGRELLFLIANNEWIRATCETVEIARSDAIDTTINLDVDLNRITHEAFRGRSGPIWLPVLVPSPVREPGSEPEPFSALSVTDAGGSPVMTLPNADIRHRVAAALAEIIIDVAARVPDASGTTFSATRDHRLLLSAAIYRVLRRDHVPKAVLVGEQKARASLEEPLPRLERTRNELGAGIESYSALLTAQEAARRANAADARELTRRAIWVLRAFAESAIVVIAAECERTPTVLTVKVPSRALHLAPWRWARILWPVTASAQRWARAGAWRWIRPGNWVLPRATLQIDVLLPSAEADRRVHVALPDGVSPDPSRPVDTRADLDIRTEQPLPVLELAMLTRQLVEDYGSQPASPLRMCIADLAAAKADAAWASLRDHRVGARPGQPSMTSAASHTATDKFRRSIDALGRALRAVTAQDRPQDAEADLRAAWDDGKPLSVGMRRRTSADIVSPNAISARALMIEDESLRAAPIEARMQVHVAVTDSEYFSTAKLAGWMSALLMTVVLGFFAAAHVLEISAQRASAEVLAFVLTLFAAIQAGRIERPDRSTMRGLLVPAGNPLIVASILPPVVLAVALAFSRSAGWAVTWAIGCISGQLVLLWLQWLLQQRGFARGRRTTARTPATGLVFYTDTPDYSHGEVLHSIWWRSTTAEALMLGRQAFGYVVWQHESGPTLRSLLLGARPVGVQPVHEQTPRAGQRRRTWRPRYGVALEPDLGVSALEQPANVLALQRSGTGGQTLNFAVFRDEPKADWDSDPQDVIRVELQPNSLAPVADATGIVGIFLGFRPSDGLQRTADHPVTAVLRLAADERLMVLDVQLPVPPPMASYADLQWARVQLGLRHDNVGRLGAILREVLRLVPDPAAPAPLRIGIQTVPAGIPRILNPPWPSLSNPGPAAGRNGSAHTRAIVASDLDVISASRMDRFESATARTWRILAICADWHTGIESEILASLDPDLELAGITATTLHGKAVVLLLGHDETGPHGRAHGHALHPPRVGRGHAARPPRAGPIMRYLDEWQSRKELGTALDEPLMRVHMRTPDRPGATLEVLEALRETLQEPGSLEMRDWNVWYARAVVAEGNVAEIQLTIRLALRTGADSEDSPITQWSAAEFAKIEDRALALAAQKMAAARKSDGPADPGLVAPEDTVIRVGLVSTPDLDEPAHRETAAVGKPATVASSGDGHTQRAARSAGPNIGGQLRPSAVANKTAISWPV